jgi:hypothetical protein
MKIENLKRFILELFDKPFFMEFDLPNDDKVESLLKLRDDEIRIFVKFDEFHLSIDDKSIKTKADEPIKQIFEKIRNG